MGSLFDFHVGRADAILQTPENLRPARVDHSPHSSSPFQRDSPCNNREIPPEIHLLIVKYATDDSNMPTRRSLVSLSRVCRAWFHFCAPMVYRRISLVSSAILSFCYYIRGPGWYIQHHVQSVTLRIGAGEISSSPRLSTLFKLLRSTLNHLEVNFLDIPSHEKQVMHRIPYSMRMLAGVYSALSNLTSLRLSCHSFSSSTDLLCLFGSLPSLSRAELSNITWQRSILLASPPRMSKLIEIKCVECAAIWPLLLCATWTRSFDGRIFAGLSREEAVLAARICQRTNLGVSRWADLRFEQSPYPHVCESRCILRESYT